MWCYRTVVLLSLTICSCFFNLLAQLSPIIPLLHLPRLLGWHDKLIYLWICSTWFCHVFRPWLLEQAGMDQRRCPVQEHKCCKVVAVGPQGSCNGTWPMESEGPWTSLHQQTTTYTWKMFLPSKESTGPWSYTTHKLVMHPPGSPGKITSSVSFLLPLPTQFFPMGGDYQLAVQSKVQCGQFHLLT